MLLRQKHNIIVLPAKEELNVDWLFIYYGMAVHESLHYFEQKCNDDDDDFKRVE